MTADHLLRGAAAERLAALHLESRGVRILARNPRSRFGELDLVALDGAVLAIVEVRQRSRVDFGGALASIGRAKRRRLVRAARYFLARSPALRGRAVRFDVIAVHGVPGAGCRIEWLKGAFGAG